MKKMCVFLFAIICIVSLCACSPKRYDENNISERYDREWIIGKSRREIEHKYGTFQREFTSDTGENLGSYYVNYENGWFDPSYIHDTYFVVFDDADIAIDAYFRKTSIGG